MVAAIASGDADAGYAAPVPPINAHIRGVPVKMYLELGQEVDPDKMFILLVASKASGIANLAGAMRNGKNGASNIAAGTLPEPKQALTSDAVFAAETWLGANGETASVS